MPLELSARRFRSPAGLSLVEVLLYSALVSAIVGVFMTSANGMITASQRDRERAAVSENWRFISQKLNWLLEQVNQGSVTPASGAAAVLTFQKANGTRYQLDSNGSLRLWRDSNGDGLFTSADVVYPISNSHAQISGLLFTRLTINGQAAARVQMTLTGRYQISQFDQTYFFL